LGSGPFIKVVYKNVIAYGGQDGDGELGSDTINTCLKNDKGLQLL